MTAQLLLALSLLVFVHELGHFLAARMFGIKVDKFFIFFDWGGKLFSKKIGDTEYGIGLFPLGGYVKIAGMIDESMDKEQMKKPPQPWEFRSKPAWQRLIVMLAGVIMNIIVGVLIFTFTHLHYNESYIAVNQIEEGIYPYEYAENIGFERGDIIQQIDGKPVLRFEDVMSTRLFFGEEVKVLRNENVATILLPDSLYRYFVKESGILFDYTNFKFSVDSVVSKQAIIAGLQENDSILSINDMPVRVFGDIQKVLKMHKNETIEMAIKRQDSIVKLSTKVDSLGRIGFLPSQYEYPIVDYTFVTAMKYGWKDAFESIRANVKGLGKVFSGEEKVQESLQGPIGIAKIFGGTWDWRRFWSITGLISMVLAFMNILPIPALDGGHVFFTLIEMAIGRKLPDKFMEIVQMIGLVIVLALMIFVIGNDIINLF